MSLTISGVSKTIKNKTILQTINLPPIPKGKIVSILGTNGAGKSTFLKEIINLINLNKKVVSVNNQSITHNDIGYLPQDYKITATLTVLEVLVTTINVNNPYLKSTSKSVEKSINTLNSIGITHLANKCCTDLSGGESQLVGLAQAIIKKPKLLILDEPTSALDLKNQIVLMNYVRNYINRFNIYGLMVIHDMNLAMKYSDLFAVFKDGKLNRYGASEIIDESMIYDVFEVRSELIKTPKSSILSITGI